MKNILSYGGGVNSTALFYFILENRLPLDMVIFSDTGEELPKTYDSVKRMEIVCKAYKIPFVTVKSSLGDLYNYYHKKKALPSVMRRDCTAKFKIRPIRKYLREKYGKKETFTMYIGIAWDEAHRLSVSDVKYITHSFPFIDDNLTREDNIKLLEKYHFKAYKSGCIGCPYIGKKGFIDLYRSDPVNFKRYRDLEENCSAFPRIKLLNKGSSLKQIEEAIKEQRTLNDYGEELSDCGESAGGCFL